MRFIDLIHSKGFTVHSLAEQAEISPRNVENYTSGRRALKNMTLELAAKIAKPLEIHAEDLLDLDD